MKFLLLYGTTEGQTRKIADAIAGHLTKAGDSVTCADASQTPPPDPAAFDGAVLLASLHAGRYQRSAADFARRHQARLSAMPSAFVSVSLAAAGSDPEERKGLDQCVQHFLDDTGWKPGEIAHIAGAFRFTEYDFFKRWVMKLIAQQHGIHPDTHQDLELTKWDEVARFAEGFRARAAKKT